MVLIRTILLTTACLTVAACGQPTQPDSSASDSSSPVAILAPTETTSNDPPQFDDKWVPPVNGKGNFEICLSDDAKENGINVVQLPPNLIFQSWGQMSGPLRNSSSSDQRAIGGTTEDDRDLSHYAVITTTAVRFSVKSPCAIIVVRMALNEEQNWTHGSVSSLDHFFFQVMPFYVKGTKIGADAKGFTEYYGDCMSGAERCDNGPKRGGFAGEVIQVGSYLNGTPLRDIGEPVTISDEGP